jgi:uncharacterized protein YjbI with pentapeptide repeats
VQKLRLNEDCADELVSRDPEWSEVGETINSRADLSGADLRGADLRGADLRGEDLRGADLSGADLSGTYLSRADLRGATLSDADLRGANLSDADLSGANYLRDADLRDADLSGADLSDANLSGADLRGVDLRGDLRRADLSGADLSGADLRGADLAGADLTGANIGEDADPEDFPGADLSGTYLADNVRWYDEGQICVEIGSASDAIRVGFSKKSKRDAWENRRSTPAQGDDVVGALRYAMPEKEYVTCAESGDEILVGECQCTSCCCDDYATTRDDNGSPVCDACVEYFVAADGEVQCANDRLHSAIVWGPMYIDAQGNRTQNGEYEGRKFLQTERGSGNFQIEEIVYKTS